MWNVFLICADVLPHHLRHVPHALRDDRERPLLRAVVDRLVLRGVPRRSSSCFASTLVLWRWPELRDIKPERRLRWARGRRGLDRHRGVPAGALLPLARAAARSAWRVDLIALVAGGRRLRGAGARVPADDAGARRARAAPADRVDPLARVHVPPQQLDPLQPALLHPRGDDVPAHQRGAHGREGHGRARRSTRRGCSRSGSCCSLLMGRGHALRLEEDEPRGAAARLPRSRHRVRAPRSSCTSRWASRSASRPSSSAIRSTRARSGSALRGFNAVMPVLGFSLCVFNVAVIVQEFVAALPRARAHRARAPGRRRSCGGSAGCPGFVHTLFSLPPQSRRRYGGYIVHLGIVLDVRRLHRPVVERRQARPRSRPGQSYQVARLHADLRGRAHGGRQQQAHGLRRRRRHRRTARTSATCRRRSSSTRSSPTRRRPRSRSSTGCGDDVYVIVGSINPQTKVAALQIHINPLVTWIWIGLLRPHPRQHRLHVAAARARRVARLGGRARSGRDGGERDPRHHARGDASARARA